MALMLMRAGRSAPDAIELIRSLRGIPVLNNTSFERWLVFEAAGYLSEAAVSPPPEGGGDT